MPLENSQMRDLQELGNFPSRIPDFFIVGAPKCGTTTLYSWLRSHPDTYLPGKEPNFLSPDVFDTTGIPGALLSWLDYKRVLMPAEMADKLTGEATPRYLYSDLALKILGCHPQQPKVLAILRNPIDLVYSLHGQMVRQGVEREVDFLKAWNTSLAGGRSGENWRSENGGIDRRLDYPMFGQLGTALERLVALIPEENLKILVLEEGLKNAKAEVYTEVLEFLELPYIDPDLTNYNERIEYKSVAIHQWLLRRKAEFEHIRGYLGLPVTPSKRRGKGMGLLKLVSLLNNRKSASVHQRLSTETRLSLTKYFDDEVRRVENVLGRPIPTWKDWH